MVKSGKPMFSGGKLTGVVLRGLVVAAVVLQGGLTLHGGLEGPRALAAVVATAPTTQPDEAGRVIPMVNADEELIAYARQAQELIESKSYDRAIEILQALILRPDAGFVAVGPAGRFIPLRAMANTLIGSMGPEGLRLYRQLYDAQARRLYDEAVRKGETRGLRRVAGQYLHTQWGPKALAMLAQICFDRGQFAQAGRSWQRLIDAAGAQVRPLLLAKVAAAYHLAGLEELARRAADELAAKHARSTASVGGREQVLVEFLRGVLAMPVLAKETQGPDPLGWPGMGGVPKGIAVMADTDAALSPQWRFPAVQGPSVGDVTDRLEARRSNFPQRGQTPQRGPRLRNGNVEYNLNARGQSKTNVLSPLIHPVVVGETVMYRADSDVIACDLVTGQKLWQSDNMPLYRPLSLQRYSSSMPPAWSVGDLGRHALTVGGGKVFFVHDFVPMVPNLSHLVRINPKKATQLSDTSSLAAVSIASQGALAWKLGGGVGDDEVVRGGKFLCVPTYDAGRLYVVSKYSGAYYLLCLDAETGRLFWKSVVSQSPRSSYGWWGYADALCRVAPPAVSDGYVFVVTNSGVVVCFDADGGQEAWAYQYESPMNTSVQAGRSGNWASLIARDVNPIIAARGKVICLPADSDKVIALAAQDGRVLWQQPRRARGQLSGIDAKRILLSGKGLMVLSVADGKVLFEAANVETQGRPAVTQRAVLACGRGKLYRMDLLNYSLRSVDLGSSEGLLGNLVVFGDKLIAANALGICAYFSYDSAWGRLSEGLEQLSLASRAERLYRRGQMSFNARRLAEAAGDVTECRTLAEVTDQAGLAEKARLLLYRTHVAAGNRAETSAQMVEHFLKAQQCAHSVQERAHIKLRLAKAYERAGDFGRAVLLGQEIADNFGQERLADVPVGDDADESVRIDPDTPLVEGSRLASDFVARMVELHGEEVYAAFDALAAEALSEARQRGEPQELLDVAVRWPASRWADEARFAAAELYYQQALRQEGSQAAALLSRVRSALGDVAGDPSGSLWVSSRVALAATHALEDSAPIVALALDPVRDLPPETSVSFANIQGPLGEVIADLEAGQVTTQPTSGPVAVSIIRPPVTEVFRIEADDTLLLRDQEFRPVRVGDAVFVLQGAKLLKLDTAAPDAKTAVVWETQTSVDVEQLRKLGHGMAGFALLGALSADGRCLAVADRVGVVGVDVDGGRVLWRKTMAEIGIGNLRAMSSGDGVLVVCDAAGQLVCLSVADGEVRWKANVARSGRMIVEPPRIGGGAVGVRSNGLKWLSCFDIRNGKLLGNCRAAVPVSYRLTSDGLLVAVVDGQLSVRRCDVPGLPIVWVKEYPVDERPVLLDAAQDRIALCPNAAGNRVDVLSISGDGQEERSFAPAAMADGEDSSVCEARFYRESLYVVCGKAGKSKLHDYYGRPGYGHAMSVQKFAPASAGPQVPLWQADIETSPALRLMYVPLAFGESNVVVSVVRQGNPMTAEAAIVDAATGQVGQVIKGLTGGPAERRFRGVGSAVITNGRMCVQTGRGVRVYAGK